MSTDVTAFGDSALLIETGTTDVAHGLAEAITFRRNQGEAPPGIEDIVVGLHTVVVQGSPATDWAELADWLSSLPRRPIEPVDGGGSAGARPLFELPVVFDGEDLDGVATALGVDTAGVVTMLCGSELSVGFLGFAPGFPYLIGLPPALAAVARRHEPRASVPAGSVAVGGGFASVYPGSSPGGWQLLGRTDVTLFDPERAPYALLNPGDRVRFLVADPNNGTAGRHRGRPAQRNTRPPLVARSERYVEVTEPGALTLIEDAGRPGLAGIGVPRSGPADPAAMAIANLLVGNPADVAALEITAVGPSLRFSRSSYLAVVSTSDGSADDTSFTIDGYRHEAGSVTPVGPGQVVAVGTVRPGLRAYLAVAGGFSSEVVLGSRSSDVLSGIGPGALRRGDVVDLGPPTRPRGVLEAPGVELLRRQSHVIGIVAGPHRLGAGTLVDFLAERWTVAAASNRIGVRLSGGRPLGGPGEGIDSVAMVTGAIQLPPGGMPIILSADHATIGGYPVLACVTSVDLPKVGQLSPGDTVVFVEVDLDAARASRASLPHDLEDRVTGWFPTEAGT